MDIESEDCRLNDQLYSHGSRICGEDGCKVCNDGNWEGVKEYTSQEQ